MGRRRAPHDIMGHDTDLARLVAELTGGDPGKDPLFDGHAPLEAPAGREDVEARAAAARGLTSPRGSLEPATPPPPNGRCEPARRPRAQALLAAPVAREARVVRNKPEGWAPLDAETIDGPGGPPPRVSSGASPQRAARAGLFARVLRACASGELALGLLLAGAALLLLAGYFALTRSLGASGQPLGAAPPPLASGAADLRTDDPRPGPTTTGSAVRGSADELDVPELDPRPSSTSAAADESRAGEERRRARSAARAVRSRQHTEIVTPASTPPTLGDAARESGRRLPKEAY